MIERIKKKKYALLLSYSAVFAFVFLLCFWYFLYNHKTIIWEGDGLAQHYLAMLYCSRFFKSILHELMAGHGLVIPMWDMSIGFGADVFTTMHYYGLGDPFTLLTVIVPEAHMDKFYCVLYFIKLYCAGLGALLFMRHHKAGRLGSIIGAIVYCFSVWGIFYCLHQYCFMVPLLWFPYVLYGVDRVLEKKNPAPFILALTGAAISNFYFLYMIVVLAIGYAVFKYFINQQKLDIKDIALTMGKFILYGASAMMASALILLPAVMTMATSSRYSAERIVQPVYSLKYYLQYLTAFTGNTVPYDWTVYGYTPLGFLSVVLLFTLKGRYKKVKICFAVLAAFSLIPFAGFALNGFAYVANRWSWCLGLLVAYIVALMVPEFEKLTHKQGICLVISAFAYVIITSVSFVSRSEANMSISALLVAEVIIILLAVSSERKYNIRILISMMAIVGVSVNAYFRFSENGIDSGMKEYLNFSEANKILIEKNADDITSDASGFYRVEEYDTPYQRNSSEIRGKYTTNYYLSMTGPYVPEFIINMALNAERTYMYKNLDSRSILEALSSVRYLLIKDGNDKALPYGYKATGKYADTSDGRINAYEADTPLAIGYAYDSYVSTEDFEKMTAPEKQEAMLYGAVVDKSSIKKADFSFSCKSILRSIEENSNISIKDGKIYVAKDGASAVLDIDKAEDSELYVVMTGLNFEGTTDRSQYSDEEWKALSPIERDNVRSVDFKGRKKTSSNIAISMGERYSSVNYMNHRNIYYCGQDDFIANLGYVEESDDSELRIHFKNAGVYDFDSIDVVVQPVGTITEGVKALSREMVTDEVIGMNTVTAKIDVDGDRLLAFSIPYSEGWTAYVDGKETELKQANVMYMALEIGKGSHDIRLVYETPYLMTGFYLSIAGIILFIIIELYNTIKNAHRCKM